MDGEAVSQNAGAEIFEPGYVFGDHVELDDVSARFLGSVETKFEVCGFAGREIARKNGAATVPIHFLFVGAQKVGAEADDPFCLRFADGGPGARPELVTRNRNFIGTPARKTFCGGSPENSRVAT